MGVQEEFEAITADIERYLGWLKGNETAWEWREEWAALSDHYGPPYVEMRPTYMTSPSEAEFTVLYQTLRLPEPAAGEGEQRLSLANQINERMEESWNNGVAWASGIGEYLNHLCADIIRPDVSELQSSVQSFSESMIAVEASLPVHWTDLDLNSWQGYSSDACQGAVDLLRSTIRDQYLTYYAHSFAVYGGCCALVAKAQEGLIDAMDEVRTGIKNNLTAWTNGYPPLDVEAFDPTVVKLAEIVTTISGKIPGWGEIQQTVFDFADLGADILDLFGIDASLEPTPFDAQDADTIYTGMTTMLQDKYLTPLENGMLALRTDKSTPIKSAQEQITPWLLDRLRGAGQEEWTHEAEPG